MAQQTSKTTDAVCAELAVQCGAANAQMIDVKSIVLSDTFRTLCEQNACGLFGQCYMCPPDIGAIDTLMAKVRTYRYALLYQTIASIEDSFDIEGMLAAGQTHMRVSQCIDRRVRGVSPAEILHLSSGGCRLCARCAKRDDEPCRFPDAALASMEGYGIDVYNTVRDTHLRYINGQNTVTFFGIVLFMEAAYGEGFGVDR